jgi:hypothetical protein
MDDRFHLEDAAEELRKHGWLAATCHAHPRTTLEVTPTSPATPQRQRSRA